MILSEFNTEKFVEILQTIFSEISSWITLQSG